MHIHALDVRVPEVRRHPIEVGLVHVAHRLAGIRFQLLADGPVAAVDGGQARSQLVPDGGSAAPAGVEFHHGAVDVRIGLVQAAGFARIHELGGVGAHAVAEFVGHHIKRGHRVHAAVGRAGTIAQDHPEVGGAPGGVVVERSAVHADEGGLAGVVDAVPAVDLLEVVPGGLQAVGRIHRHRLAVVPGGGAAGNVVLSIAPGVVRIRVDAPDPAVGMIQVADHVAGGPRGPGEVAHLVVRARAVGGDLHRAVVLGTPRALDALRLQRVPAPEEFAAVGIHQEVRAAKAIQRIVQLRVHVVGQGEAGGPLIAVGIDHQLRRGGHREPALGGEAAVDQGQHLWSPEGGRDVQFQAPRQGIRGFQKGFLGIHMGDDVPAPYGHPAELLAEAGVRLPQVIGQMALAPEGMARVQPQAVTGGRQMALRQPHPVGLPGLDGLQALRGRARGRRRGRQAGGHQGQEQGRSPQRGLGHASVSFGERRPDRPEGPTRPRGFRQDPVRCQGLESVGSRTCTGGSRKKRNPGPAKSWCQQIEIPSKIPEL
ncbi:MAG: hypothetical protein BWY56_02210 [Acidobacteria bacterium ADurb.Bin340]|nr:MAG: hypothetical protein BWY56_02210 [Acidobacteria bacterium ADurb.Bin340]